MKYLFLFFAVSASIFSSCKEDEENIGCACSATFDEYQNPDTSVFEVIYIPNAFTPTSDGKNELFCIYGIGVSSAQVLVKDGNTIVFQATNITNCWDGAVSGSVPHCRNCDYVVDVTFNSGISQHFEGTVSLINYDSCSNNLTNCKFPNQFNLVIGGFDPNLSSGEIGC